MPITDDDIRQIQGHIQPLIGQASWQILVGRINWLILNFGEKQTSDEHPEFGEYGEWQIRIKSSWRLETREQVLRASGDSREEVIAGIKQVESLPIRAIDILRPSLYTTIEFEGGYFLRLIPIYMDKHCHWQMVTPDYDALTLGPGSQWSFET
jgi:hypothetical protein